MHASRLTRDNTIGWLFTPGGYHAGRVRMFWHREPRPAGPSPATQRRHVPPTGWANETHSSPKCSGIAAIAPASAGAAST